MNGENVLANFIVHVKSTVLCISTACSKSVAFGALGAFAALSYQSTACGQDVFNSKDPEWGLRAVHAFEAWNLFSSRNLVPGAGTTIALLDNGLLPHPKIAPNGKFLPNVLFERGFDFENHHPEPYDLLIPTFGFGTPTPGHGTALAGLLISPHGRAPGVHGDGQTSGVAPGASLIPYRVTQVPVILNVEPVIEAINRAIEEDVDIIHMSFGTLPHQRLYDVVHHALKRGIILVASGGQVNPIVPSPADIPGVIAVTGVQPDFSIVPNNATGSAISIAAPGKDILYPASSRNQDGEMDYSYYPGTGTSFASPFVSGAASLWLSWHGGRQKLIEKYGRENVPKLFQHMLLKYGYDRPLPWNYSHYGVGVINIEKLLKAPLPAIMPTYIGGYRSKPSEIVGMGYQGWFKNLGVPAAALFCYRMRYSPTAPRELGQAAFSMGYIPETPDNVYIEDLKKQSEFFCH